MMGSVVGTGNIWRFPRILANNATEGGKQNRPYNHACWMHSHHSIINSSTILQELLHFSLCGLPFFGSGPFPSSSLRMGLDVSLKSQQWNPSTSSLVHPTASWEAFRHSLLYLLGEKCGSKPTIQYYQIQSTCVSSVNNMATMQIVM